MPITIQEFTDGNVAGAGIFDHMMRSVEAHLQEEYQKSRIRGPEYAQVYLGSIQAVMDRSMAFLLEREKIDLGNQILQVQLQQAEIQRDKLLVEKDLVAAQITKINKENALLDEQILSEQKRNKLDGILDKEITVLKAQQCKLDAEFDVLILQKDKVIAETGVLNQKKVTEAAQTSGVATDPDSVIGRQKDLFLAQTNGFSRDAEQKAAKILVDTWNVRRTTDSGTIAGVDGATDNGLGNESIGAVIAKLKAGISA